MNHPFAMSLCDLTDLDLNVEIPLSAEEASQVGGGLSILTKAWNEGGGDCEIPLPICEIPKCPPIKLPIKPCPWPKPPIMTTMALGEEGGGGCYLM
jgi:hypothetical protein